MIWFYKYKKHIYILNKKLNTNEHNFNLNKYFRLLLCSNTIVNQWLFLTQNQNKYQILQINKIK